MLNLALLTGAISRRVIDPGLMAKRQVLDDGKIAATKSGGESKRASE